MKRILRLLGIILVLEVLGVVFLIAFPDLTDRAIPIMAIPIAVGVVAVPIMLALRFSRRLEQERQAVSTAPINRDANEQAAVRMPYTNAASWAFFGWGLLVLLAAAFVLVRMAFQGHDKFAILPSGVGIVFGSFLVFCGRRVRQAAQRDSQNRNRRTANSST